MLWEGPVVVLWLAMGRFLDALELGMGDVEEFGLDEAPLYAFSRASNLRFHDSSLLSSRCLVCEGEAGGTTGVHAAARTSVCVSKQAVYRYLLFFADETFDILTPIMVCCCTQ